MVDEPSISLGKKQGRRILDRLDGFSTSIGADNILVGEIRGEGHCIVLGRVEGDSVLQGTLVIGENGSWKGKIEAQNIVIAGQVDGSILAREKLELVSTARVKGSLNSPIIAIAEGAIHDGEIHMRDDGEYVKRFSDQRRNS